jgi:hypothetical protein
VLYFPKLHTSISVFVLERDVKNKVIKQTIESLVTEISNDSFLEESIIEENYQLYKAKDSKATLVLFPGGGSTAKETKEEFDIITAATANNISVLFMNFNGGLWIDNETTKDLANDLESAFTDNKVNTKNTFIGGMSIGGNVALTLSNYLNQQKSNIITKGVFIVDSPIDLYALYESSIKDILNPNFDEERLAEPKWIVNYFEKEFSKDSLLINIQEVSPFIGKNKNTSVPNLKNSKVRFYIEPDSLWYKEIRLTDFESTNAYAIQQIARDLKTKNWNQLELIETQGKGYRANGERNPHSWSIVNVDELIEWILE